MSPAHTLSVQVLLKPQSYQINPLHGDAAAETSGGVHDAEWANALARDRPEFSAKSHTPAWQLAVAATLVTALGTGLWFQPRDTIVVTLAVLSPVFLSILVLRMAALWELVRSRPEPRSSNSTAVTDTELPVYTVLIPLYKEEDVVADLLHAIGQLNYPRDRLEVLFIVERDDEPTLFAIQAAALPSHMQIVIVPAGEPRTKPRALTYALRYATGQYVVVYDAEDVPEPAQLRKALARLQSGDGRIGCVQARLNIYNPDEGFLTRQFTLEYTALFDAVLPALERFNLPVPLGGTSNHFPRAVLDEAGGWDPYNVTEDADLGIRLARAGWRVEILESTTWEEAPPAFNIWFGQRVRWLKGWMQTYLVHNRYPLRLLQDLGFARFAGLQILMGGLLLSALAHPLFYGVVVFDMWNGHQLLQPPENAAGRVLWWFGVLNLFAAYLAAVVLAATAVARRRRASLGLFAVLMPVYWLLISAAAYRALFQLATAPFWWQKTAHSDRRRRCAVP